MQPDYKKDSRKALFGFSQDAEGCCLEMLLFVCMWSTTASTGITLKTVCHINVWRPTVIMNGSHFACDGRRLGQRNHRTKALWRWGRICLLKYVMNLLLQDDLSINHHCNSYSHKGWWSLCETTMLQWFQWKWSQPAWLLCLNDVDFAQVVTKRSRPGTWIACMEISCTVFLHMLAWLFVCISMN